MRETADGFIGWMRLPRQRWQAVCQSADRDQCQADLLAHAIHAPGVHKDLTCLPSGQHPADRPVKVARVRDTELSFLDAAEAGTC